MNDRRDYEERQARNDASRARAEHHQQPWSSDELDLLAEWDGTEAELAVIAELIGRTIEACRQRFYEVRRGHLRVRVERITVTVVTGWLVGYCFHCGRFTDVYSDGTVSLCEDCC